MWCHLLLSLPFVGLVLFQALPFQYALPAYLVLNLPALYIYYLVGRAQRRPAQVGAESLIGAEAEVTALRPHHGLANCLVRCQGELWSAYAIEPVGVGSRVRVLGLEGIRPVVGASPEGEGSTPTATRRW